LFVCDEPIALGPQGIDLKHVAVAVIVRGIDRNLEIVIELLAYIAAHLLRHDPAWLRVVTDDSEEHIVLCVKNADFRALRWRLSFVGFALSEVGKGLG
jgi:hypothetical protein